MLSQKKSIMKKLFVLAFIMLSAAAVFSCSKEKTSNYNQETTINSPKEDVYFSACYMWWQIVNGRDTCVNYCHYNQIDPVICGLQFPDDPECETYIVFEPHYTPGGNGNVLQSLTIHNYDQISPEQKVLFDRLLEKGEITIMDGITIDNDEMLEILGENDYVDGGTFPFELVDGKPVITLK